MDRLQMLVFLLEGIKCITDSNLKSTGSNIILNFPYLGLSWSKEVSQIWVDSYWGFLLGLNARDSFPAPKCLGWEKSKIWHISLQICVKETKFVPLDLYVFYRRLLTCVAYKTGWNCHWCIWRWLRHSIAAVPLCQ